MARQIGRRCVLDASWAFSLPLARAQGANASELGDLPTAGAAYEPWRSWRLNPADGPVGLVRSAILAANAHDTQPWLFCVDADHIDIFADESRNLGAMDPFRREMQLSLGCAIENLVLAAGASGYEARHVATAGRLPGDMTGPRFATRVKLRKVGAILPSPLTSFIPRRHTNRAAYDRSRLIDPELLSQLQGTAAEEDGVRLVLSTDPTAQADFAAATVAATQAIIANSAMIAASDAWFRTSDAEIEVHRDGPTLYAAGLSPFTLFMARLLPISPERSHRAWLDNTRDVQLATAAGFGLIAVRDLYDCGTALAAGRLWQRLHLTSVSMGLAMQPMNQLPERVDRERQLGLPSIAGSALASLVRNAEWHPTFAFRIGWPMRTATASPRRDPRTVVLPGRC